MAEIKTRTATIWLADDGVVHVKVDEGAVSSLDDARTNVEAVAQLLAGRKAVAVIDIRKVGPTPREARLYFTGPETGRVCRAVALLIDSPLSRMVANFQTGLNKGAFPFSVFTSEDDALAWLRTQAA